MAGTKRCHRTRTLRSRFFQIYLFSGPRRSDSRDRDPRKRRDYSDAPHSELTLPFSSHTPSVKPHAPQVREISIEMKLQGLHHVTALTNGSSQTCEFFAGILNMELAKDNQRGL